VVTTVLGGLHEAKFLSSSEEGNELSEENLKELEVNVISFGNMIKMLLPVCPALDKYHEVSCQIPEYNLHTFQLSKNANIH
jgi:hypothetical protein